MSYGCWFDSAARRSCICLFLSLVQFEVEIEWQLVWFPSSSSLPFLFLNFDLDIKRLLVWFLLYCLILFMVSCLQRKAGEPVKYAKLGSLFLSDTTSKLAGLVSTQPLRCWESASWSGKLWIPVIWSFWYYLTWESNQKSIDSEADALCSVNSTTNLRFRTLFVLLVSTIQRSCT